MERMMKESRANYYINIICYLKVKKSNSDQTIPT